MKTIHNLQNHPSIREDGHSTKLCAHYQYTDISSDFQCWDLFHKCPAWNRSTINGFCLSPCQKFILDEAERLCYNHGAARDFKRFLPPRAYCSIRKAYPPLWGSPRDKSQGFCTLPSDYQKRDSFRVVFEKSDFNSQGLHRLRRSSRSISSPPRRAVSQTEAASCRYRLLRRHEL